MPQLPENQNRQGLQRRWQISVGQLLLGTTRFAVFFAALSLFRSSVLQIVLVSILLLLFLLAEVKVRWTGQAPLSKVDASLLVVARTGFFYGVCIAASCGILIAQGVSERAESPRELRVQSHGDAQFAWALGPAFWLLSYLLHAMLFSLFCTIGWFAALFPSLKVRQARWLLLLNTPGLLLLVYILCVSLAVEVSVLRL